jgi:hypothetical protein
MLRITREDESRRRVTLRLEGNITGEWAGLLERECVSLLGSRSVVSLDLAGVSYVDRGGVLVLERLCRAGVEIWCRWEPVADVLEGEGVVVNRNSRPVERDDGGSDNGRSDEGVNDERS